MVARKWCFVPACTNTTIRTPTKIFVSVPREIRKRKAWFAAVRRDFKKVSLASTLYCCEDHFNLEQDMQNYLEYTLSKVKARMKDNVAPHIFACQPDKSENKTPRITSERRAQKRKVEELLCKSTECLEDVPVPSSSHNEQPPDSHGSKTDLFSTPSKDTATSPIKSNLFVQKTFKKPEPQNLFQSHCNDSNTDTTEVSDSDSEWQPHHGSSSDGNVTVEDPKIEESKFPLMFVRKIEKRLRINMENTQNTLECDDGNSKQSSPLVPKIEYQDYDNDPFVTGTNFDGNQVTGDDTSKIAYNLVKVEENLLFEGSRATDDKCMNEKCLKIEQNHSSEDHLPKIVKQEFFYERDSVDSFPQNDNVKIQDTKDNLIHEEAKVWISNDGICEQTIRKIEEEREDLCTDDFVFNIPDNLEDKHTSIEENTKLNSCANSDLTELNDDCRANDGSEMQSSMDIQGVGNTVDDSLILENFKCQICDHVTTEKQNLEEHVKTVHFDVKFFQCTLCDYQSPSKVNFRFHQKYGHTDSKNFECDKCDFKTHRKSNLTSHVNSVHLKMKNFECQMCDYNAFSKYRLEKHVDAVHLNLKHYKCSLCEYQTYEKINFKYHMEGVHLERKNFKCETCDFETHRKANLTSHVKAKHLKLKNFKCETCEYSASSKYKLKKHAESLHSNQRIRKCTLCVFQTNDKVSLKSHIEEIHTELKFKCQLCDYVTQRKFNLVIHNNAVHLKSKAFKCQMCDYAASRKQKLEKHVEAIHLRVKTFKCTQCNYQSSKKNNFRLHMEGVHI